MYSATPLGTRVSSVRITRMVTTFMRIMYRQMPPKLQVARLRKCLFVYFLYIFVVRTCITGHVSLAWRSKMDIPSSMREVGPRPYMAALRVVDTTEGCGNEMKNETQILLLLFTKLYIYPTADAQLRHLAGNFW